MAGLGLDAVAGLTDWSPLHAIGRQVDGQDPSASGLAWASLAVLATASARLARARQGCDDACSGE
ncbi:MAG: hypothetical protein P8106_00280 [Gammaproteobacteria bacterium]